MTQEPLAFSPVEEWVNIQKEFALDLPRGLPAYNVLENQRRLINEGFDYGFKVYCPFGDAKNGFVALNEKAASYEVVIHCPKDDTSLLEEALRTTKLVDWDRDRLTFPFVCDHVMGCINKIMKDKNVEINTLGSDMFILEKDSPLFDVSLPPGYTFELLKREHANLIDTKWPHRYPSSLWYFEYLINANCGYGLYKNGELMSWILISESGFLTHLYTLEEHRGKRYAELVLKLISNVLLKKRIQVFAFCVKGNASAYRLYERIRFKKTIEIAWCWLEQINNK